MMHGQKNIKLPTLKHIYREIAGNLASLIAMTHTKCCNYIQAGILQVIFPPPNLFAVQVGLRLDVRLVSFPYVFPSLLTKQTCPFVIKTGVVEL